MNIVCPHCGREHHIFRFVHKGGKEHICYRCDHVEEWNQHNKTMRWVTKNLSFTGMLAQDVIDQLPQEFTLSRKKELTLKNQLQFVMIHEKPRRN